MSQSHPLSDEQKSEVRHRFANAFQLVSALSRMRMQKAPDPETRRQLSWMLDATNVLGLVQQRCLSANPDNLSALIQDLAPQWRRRCAGRPIQIDLTIDPVEAREQIQSAAALIANELVSNALAHAFPDDRAGRILVELRPLGDDQAELIVSDDGCGYAPAIAPGPACLGLWLVKGMTQQVRGTMTTTTEQGVTARLVFGV